MFGKKNYVIEPKAVDENVLIQMSEPTEISKKTKITVPPQYKADVFVDFKHLCRVEPCVNMEFVKTYGKEYIGKRLQIAFVANRTIAQSGWGFGNIQVNNEALKEAYRIGANGKFSINIVDHVTLISSFPNSSEITIDQIREKTLSTLKTIGTPILAEYFSKTSTSVFEMSSLVSDFRDKFMDNLQNEKIFGNMGIKISMLTVDGFHANEDDLELIRNRINA